MARLLAPLLVLASLLVACGDGESPAGGEGEAPVETSEAHWERLRGSARAIGGLQNMVPVLAGDRVVVIAGVDFDQTSVEGLLIDPGSRRWSRAAPSRLWWRFGLSAVAAGDRVILWGGCCGGGGRGSRAPGAIYDVAGNRWTPVEGGPFGNRYNHTAVWTGEEMIVWGGVEGIDGSTREALRDDGAAFNPRSGTWRRIAEAPLSPRQYHVAVWTGEDMIVWGGSRPLRPLRSEQERLFYDGAAYDPERDKWRKLAPRRLLSAPRPVLGTALEPDFTAAWTGDEMIVWSSTPGVAAGALYAPDRDRWQRIPPPPPAIRKVRFGGSAVWTGEQLIVWGGTGSTGNNFLTEGAAYDPESNRWTALPEPPIAGRDAHAAIWTGEGMLVWGGFGDDRYQADGAIYVPD